MTDIVDVPQIVSELTPALTEGAHLFFDTPFSEYTVNEGLLLLILVFGFICFIIWLLRGGF